MLAYNEKQDCSSPSKAPNTKNNAKWDVLQCKSWRRRHSNPCEAFHKPFLLWLSCVGIQPNSFCHNNNAGDKCKTKHASLKFPLEKECWILWLWLSQFFLMIIFFLTVITSSFYQWLQTMFGSGTGGHSANPHVQRRECQGQLEHGRSVCVLYRGWDGYLCWT